MAQPRFQVLMRKNKYVSTNNNKYNFLTLYHSMMTFDAHEETVLKTMVSTL